MTTPPTQQHIGIHVSGVGDDTTANGMLFVDEALDAHQSGTRTFRLNATDKSFNLIDQLITPDFGSIEDRIDYFSNEIRPGGFDFDMRGTDTAATLLRGTQQRAQFEISENISSSETAITTTATGGSLANTVVFIGDEAIKLGSHNGSGEYTGSTRGYFLSTPDEHRNGANIFTDLPSWNGRTIRVFTYNLNDTAGGHPLLRQRYIGQIDGSLQQDGPTLTMPTSGLIAGAFDVRVNTNPIRSVDLQSEYLQLHPNTISGEITFGSDASRVIKPNSTNERAVFQVNNQIMVLDQGAAVIDLTDTPLQPKEEIRKFNELFVVSTEWDELVESEVNLNPVSSTRDLSSVQAEAPYHPVGIVMAFLMSSKSDPVVASDFDVLHENWSLESSDLIQGNAFFASSIVSDAKSLISDFPDDQIHSNYVLGWDGKDVDIWEEMTNLLSLFSYGWSITPEGSLTIKKRDVPDIAFWDTAQSNTVTPKGPGPFVADDGEKSKIGTVQANIGWDPRRKKRKVQIQALDITSGSKKMGKVSRDPGLRLNFNTIDITEEEIARNALYGLVQMTHFKNPVLQCLVADYIDESSATGYGIGDGVTINELPLKKGWYVDPDGNRVRLDPTAVTDSGVIIGRRYKPHKRSYELSIMLFAHEGLARWRSPSGLVESTNSGSNEITLSDFAPMENASDFETGDEVQIYTTDGSLVDSTINEISSISGRTLTLDGWGYGTPPSPNDVVELAHIDSDESGTGFLNLNTSSFSNIRRAYLGLANRSSETIGDSSDLDVYAR